MPAKLKPCPFCGGNPRVVQSESAPGEISGRFIFCDSCTGTFEFAHVVPRVELIAGWNNRADTKEENLKLPTTPVKTPAEEPTPKGEVKPIWCGRIGDCVNIKLNCTKRWSCGCTWWRQV